MGVKLRAGTPDDADVAGRVCYEAFGAIADAHNFPRDFPSVEFAKGALAGLLAHPGFFSVVAEQDGAIVGSNFLDERSVIAGVGPITVSPTVQDAGVGRSLMDHVLQRASEQRFAGVRLVQAAYHNRSLSLYAKLGFQVREPLACMQGPPVAAKVPGYSVRQATKADLDASDALCRAVHGHDRSRELDDAITPGTALVVEHDGRVTGYTTGVAFFGHTVGESNEAVAALIGAAEFFAGPGLLVPMRNGALFEWCLAHGLRVAQLMTLMTTGLYNEPAGSYLPSILF
jgi:predicted N-acetyltransferase YhbS